MADRPEMFGPTRGFSEMADSMEPYNMLWGRPLLPWQRNFGKFGLFLQTNAYSMYACMPRRPDIFGPNRGPTLVAIATTFALGTESNRLPACICITEAVSKSEVVLKLDKLSVVAVASICQQRRR